MSVRPLGNNTFTGVRQFWHEDGEGNWAVEYDQLTDGILDLNKDAQNHGAPRSMLPGDARMVARIPYIVITHWRAKYGIDYWDPDHQDKVNALLNSNEWCWLRTDTGSL